MDINDPTTVDQRKAALESAMVDPSRRTKTAPLGKVTLTPLLWASGKIESTPYCIPPKPVRVRTDSKLSNIHFDDFNYARGKEVLDAEMPRGKRIL